MSYLKNCAIHNIPFVAVLFWWWAIRLHRTAGSPEWFRIENILPPDRIGSVVHASSRLCPQRLKTGMT